MIGRCWLDVSPCAYHSVDWYAVAMVAAWNHWSLPPPPASPAFSQRLSSSQQNSPESTGTDRRRTNRAKTRSNVRFARWSAPNKTTDVEWTCTGWTAKRNTSAQTKQIKRLSSILPFFLSFCLSFFLLGFVSFCSRRNGSGKTAGNFLPLLPWRPSETRCPQATSETTPATPATPITSDRQMTPLPQVNKHNIKDNDYDWIKKNNSKTENWKMKAPTSKKPVTTRPSNQIRFKFQPASMAIGGQRP